MGNKDKHNARKITSDYRNTSTIQSIESLSTRHGERLQHWLSTWDAVDHALLTRLTRHIKESANPSHLIPDTGCLFDSFQNSGESAVSTALERIEHLITICQKASSTKNHPSN